MCASLVEEMKMEFVNWNTFLEKEQEYLSKTQPKIEWLTWEEFLEKDKVYTADNKSI
jgi:hypothetical protein